MMRKRKWDITFCLTSISSYRAVLIDRFSGPTWRYDSIEPTCIGANASYVEKNKEGLKESFEFSN
jgi:hypothetical protein